MKNDEVFMRSANAYRLWKFYEKEALKSKQHAILLKEEINTRQRRERVERRGKKRAKVQSRDMPFIDKDHEKRFYSLLHKCINTPKLNNP